MWSTEGPTPPTPTDYGIYRKPSLGLISLSSDGETWITIADKNLWATQVYNSWDTKTEANCWKMYQWWNNYWFPFSWPETIVADFANASWYWPGDYYSSNLFVKHDSISAWINRSYVNNNNLWWLNGTVEQRQGPCLEGYHIPTSAEFADLKDMLSWVVVDAYNLLDTSTGECMKQYLKMPYAWVRKYDTWNLIYQNSLWAYWTTFSDNSGVCRLREMDSWYNSATLSGKMFGCSIRPFKNEPVTPDETWTKLVWLSDWWNSIYHNSSLGLISIVQRWYSETIIRVITISDKNLWATVVYNDWDNLSQSNCWNLFQRWNNYWFSYNWEISYRPSPIVNVSWYWPNNYYSDSSYRITSDRFGNIEWWMTWNVVDLWWWQTDTVESKRWPCWVWFHIPSNTEGILLNKTMLNLSLLTPEAFMNMLKIPTAGYRWYTPTQWSSSSMWTSTSDGDWAYNLSIAYYDPGVSGSISPTSACYPIRPFKNSPVVPDDTWTKLF